MKLKFPPLSGGIIQGLNDAGIETFEGDYAHYVVRECTQNSLDAAASHHEPVEMEIAMRCVMAVTWKTGYGLGNCRCGRRTGLRAASALQAGLPRRSEAKAGQRSLR